MLSEILMMKLKDQSLHVRKLLLLLLLRLLVFVSAIDLVAGADDAVNYVLTDCQENLNYTYTSGSAFQENLNYTLLTVLTGNASVEHFHGFSAGGAGDEAVYALYLCRGDINDQLCHDCVEAASKKLLQRCWLQKQGIVFYQECVLRYANRSIFSQEEVLPSGSYYNESDIVSESNLDPYKEKFDRLMLGLVDEAAYTSTSNNGQLGHFATGETKLSPSGQVLRGLVQCTPDIANASCETCLGTALRQRTSWAYTMVFLPSCFFRFDVYRSLSVSPPPAQPGSDKRKVIIIVSTIGSFLLLGGILFLMICCSRARKNRSSEQRPVQNDNPVNRHNGMPLHSPENRNKGRPVQPGNQSPRKIVRPVGFTRFSYSQVKKMTNGLERKLGEGGFGVVYYGRLTDGISMEVAVKVLSKDAPKQFSTEIEVFGKISHKNLVSLIGYCQDGTNLALVYEYMAGGDLRAFLSGSECSSWSKRLEIAIDSAQGLDYLHNGCRPPIVHRDVKSPNILLNQQLQARIADFGFSKIFPDEYVSVLSTRVIGSPGYLDPQYHLTGQLNEKSDVYSFGVVLLELVTGKAAKVSTDTSLVQLVRPMLDRGDMDSIVDPRLQQVQTRASVWRLTDLAMECVKSNAIERPTMSMIVTELKECLAMEIGASPSAPPSPTTIGMVSAVASFSTNTGPDPR